MKARILDLAIGTIFRGEDGVTYRKSAMGTGFHEDGTTDCIPKLGGQFQSNARLVKKFPNKMEVEVTSSDE